MRTQAHWLAHNTVQCAVASGKLPRPDSLKCADCRGRAREYDHFRGYEKRFRLTVEAVCTSCHGFRMNRREERKYKRGRDSALWKHRNKVSEMTSKELRWVRKYHREYMRIWRKRNAVRISIY